MSRRTIRQKGVAVRRSALSVPVVVLVALLAGCAPDGGDPQKGSEELTAPTEKTEMIEETTATQDPAERHRGSSGGSRRGEEQGNTTTRRGRRVEHHKDRPLQPGITGRADRVLQARLPDAQGLPSRRSGGRRCLLPGGDERGHDDGGGPLGARVRVHGRGGPRDATAGLSLCVRIILRLLLGSRCPQNVSCGRSMLYSVIGCFQDDCGRIRRA
jgi:hypothetical protein